MNFTNSSTLAYGEITHIGDRAIRSIMENIRDHDNYGIVATKQMKEYLVKQSDFPHECILFDQGWSNIDKVDELMLEKEFMALIYGGMMAHEVYGLNPHDEYVAAYYDLCIRGEVMQAIGRARLYGESIPFRKVYIIGNMPTSLEIDHVMRMPSIKKDPLMEAARHMIHHHGRFSMHELVEASHYSERQIRNRIDDIIVSLGLVEIIGSHTRKDYVGYYGETLLSDSNKLPLL